PHSPLLFHSLTPSTLLLLCLSHSLFFFFSSSAHHRDLHSFPTRRSSDLDFVSARRRRWRDHQLLPLPVAAFHWAGLPACRSRARDRKSTRLNSSHRTISYAVFCLKKKKKNKKTKYTTIT